MGYGRRARKVGRGKSSKRVGNGRNRAGVTLFNISQPKKGKKMRSPRPARWDIWYQFQAFPSVLRWMERYMYWTVNAIPGRDLPVLNFVNRPVCTNQFHLPKNSRSAWNWNEKWNTNFRLEHSVRKKKFRFNYPECRMIIQLLSNRIFPDFSTRFSGICLFTIVNYRDRRFIVQVHQHGVRDVMWKGFTF